MKKLLVVLLSAILVLSLAAVSMAAATVSGDWRTEYQRTDHSVLAPSKNDLRLNFNGKVSDTVDAYAQIAFGENIGTTLDNQASPKKINLPIAFKEWYVTFNQSFGKVMYGDWDYKIHPDRVLIKSHDNLSVVPDTTYPAFLVEVPFADAFTAGLWFQGNATKNQQGYDAKLAYKADSFGAEVHIGNNMDVTNATAKDTTYVGFDAYYNVVDGIKVFAFGTQADKTFSKLGKDGLDPVIGATFSNIAGSKLTASLEYDLEEELKTLTADAYNRYGLQLKYGFNNKVNLEVEYTNAANDDFKLVIRPRVKF